jgi:hypothetical protein
VAGNGSASFGEGGEASVCGTRRERICPLRAFRDVTVELTTHFVAGDWAMLEWAMSRTRQGDY